MAAVGRPLLLNRLRCSSAATACRSCRRMVGSGGNSSTSNKNNNNIIKKGSATGSATAAEAARRVPPVATVAKKNLGTPATSFDDGWRPFQITTPIYYVNDKPHIGHAYTSIGTLQTTQAHTTCPRTTRTHTHTHTGMNARVWVMIAVTTSSS